MTEKRVRKKFSDEFNQEAVNLVIDQGYSYSRAAEALSIKEEYLKRWKKLVDDQNKPGSVSTFELIRLRRENKQLKMEKEVLKKASAFFAREMS